MQRFKGPAQLLFDVVENITNLVERTHNAVAAKSFGPLLSTKATEPVTKTVKAVHDTTSGTAYKTVRGVNRGVNKLLDAAFDLQQSDTPTEHSDRAVTHTADARSLLAERAGSVLNALYGDYLNKRQNALDIGMGFRLSGRPLPVARNTLEQHIPDATGKVVIFVHGLACTEREWNVAAEEFYGDTSVNFGSMLKRDLGYTPFFARYNTGRHVSENGRLFSELMAQLVDEYPGDIEELVVIGHSMGGLVARSAAHHAASNNEPWVQRLQQVFCLGSPHLGSPIEKGVNLLSSVLSAFDTAGTQVPAEILNARSAGIKDMRFGYTMDQEWSDKNPDAFLENNRGDAQLVDGVGYHVVAATVTRDPEHPLGALLGDLFVSLPSATGQARQATRRIPFQSDQVFPAMKHLHLANHPDVYLAIRELL